MEAGNKTSPCRLCLNDEDCSIYLFQEHPGGMYVPADIIKDFLQIQVSKEDGYPQFACIGCFDKLKDILRFRKQCMESIVAYDKFLSLNQDGLKEMQTISPAPFICKEELPWDKPLKISRAAVGACEEEPPWDDPPEDPLAVVKEELEDATIEGESNEIGCAASDVWEEEPLWDDPPKDPLAVVKEESEDATIEGELNEHHLRGIGSPSGDISEEVKSERLDESGEDHSQGLETQETLGRPYRCLVCCKTYACKKNLERHSAAHDGQKVHSCGKSLMCKDKLRHHKKSHAPDKHQYKKQRMLLTNGNKLEWHDAEPEYSCKECGRTFRKKRSLQTHLNKHKIYGPFICKTCGTSYSNESNLLKHHRHHVPSGPLSSERPFQCPICGEAFSGIRYLAAHRMCHAGKKLLPMVQADMGESLEMSSPSRPRSMRQLLPKPATTGSMAPIKIVTYYQRKWSSPEPDSQPKKQRTYPCVTCGESFTELKNLLVHQQCHKPKKRLTPAQPKAGQSSPAAPVPIDMAYC